MQAPEFTHLHVHSDYSFLDGGASVKGLVDRAARLGMKSLALTDHGVMCGLMEFKKACDKTGVRPILGSEIYVVPHDMRQKAMAKGKEYAHLVLLAENDTGYRNLVKIVSAGFTDGFYRKPRVDYETLSRHHEGIIALTACLGGEVPQAILQGREDDAACKVRSYLDIFGKDNLFLEVQNHSRSHCGTLEQRVAARMEDLASKLDVRCVLTNDSHYLNEDDFDSHNVLLCINMAKSITEAADVEYGPDFYLKSQQEMAELYPSRPDLMQNTVAIAERCYAPLKRSQQYALPSFPCPDGMTDAQYLERLCMEGLHRLYGDPLSETVRARYRFEYETIAKMGFVSYFLITADFVNWAKRQGIPVGPGRGSATGSIISYSLGITAVDPLRYNLLFERFLNPDRISMPDIDIDFCQDRRVEVLDYVRRKYGAECVCQIGTFNKLLSRAVLKDVGRVMDVPLSRINAMTKQIEVKQGKVPPIEEILRTNEALRAEYDSDPEMKILWDRARHLEGLTRGAGVHAAGVVIAPSPVTDYIPLMRHKEDDDDVVIATQYTMTEVEDQGLLKMDFLGLTNLTTIEKALRYIERDTGEKIDIGAIPLDDAKTYEQLATGDGFGLFQLESEGMCKLLKAVKPSTFEDISAVLAIYRPGPLKAGVDQLFAARKSGRDPIVMPGETEGLASPEAVEKLKPILSDTYGLLIYQEQAMLMTRELGGFTPGKADLLRKAIGKKNVKLMEELRPQFIDGCENNGFGRKLGEHLWALMEGFGEYGFNKCHTVGYGIITYQTAWLRANYSVQYAAALISSNIGDNDGIIECVRHVRGMGVPVLPPDINLSQSEFSTTQATIMFGLCGLKGAGTKAIETILKARKSCGGRFKGFLQFLESVDHTAVGKPVIEALVRSGAFDSFNLKRAALVAGLDAALALAVGAARDKARGQKNMFGGAVKDLSEAEEHARDLSTLPNVAEWSDADKQRAEKEAFGFYISSSPMDSALEMLARFRTHTSATLQTEAPRRRIVLGGMLRAVKVRKVKKDTSPNYGREMADFELQDPEGVVRVTAFPNEYETVKEQLKEDAVVFLRGVTELQMDGGIGMTLGEIVPIENAEKVFGDDPLLKYGKLFRVFCRPTPDDLMKLPEGARAQIAGAATKVAAKRSQKGNDYIDFTLVSRDGSVRVMCFRGVLESARKLARDNAALLVKGTVKPDPRGPVLYADEIMDFDEAQRTLTGAVCIRMPAGGVCKPALESLRTLVEKHRGPLPLFLKLEHGENGSSRTELVRASAKFSVTPAPDFFHALESTFGADCYEVVAK